MRYHAVLYELSYQAIWDSWSHCLNPVQATISQLLNLCINSLFDFLNSLGFHSDIQNLFTILRKNLYPDHVLNRLLHRYVTKAVVGNDTRPSTGDVTQEVPKHYFKIPYVGHFSGVAQQRVRKLIHRFCKPRSTSNLFILPLKLRTCST